MRNLLLLALGIISLPLIVATCNYEEPIEKPLEYTIVKVTMYTTDVRQTDSTPFITASGFKLNEKNPKKHRIIAISRDLRKKLKFGDKVRLEGIGKYDGEYVVHDLMNKRWKNRIDILINPNDKPTMFKQAKLIIL
jgi:3D (Asp-Asp-Asp) domain-containing protein